MVHKTVLKVDISCGKCKKMILMAISNLDGIDKLEADTGKGTITVTGDADPVKIITRVRKTGKHVQVETIGPPPKPEESKKPPEVCKPPPSCGGCEHVGLSVWPSYEPQMGCIIL